MKINDKIFDDIWSQDNIPVFSNLDKKERPKVRLPSSQNHSSDSQYFHQWLQNNHKSKPIWIENENCWKIPKSWSEDIIKKVLKKYSKVYIIHACKPKNEVCAPVCWNAKGWECVCSCGGKNHTSGRPEGTWYIVSGTYAIRRSDYLYSCRLIESV